MVRMLKNMWIAELLCISSIRMLHSSASISSFAYSVLIAFHLLHSPSRALSRLLYSVPLLARCRFVYGERVAGLDRRAYARDRRSQSEDHGEPGSCCAYEHGDRGGNR